MSYQVKLLPGDGIGPEVMAQARAVLDEVSRNSKIKFELEEIPCGGHYYLKHRPAIGRRARKKNARERT